MEVVETYTRSYFEDMDALGVRRPDISPRASGHVPEQIKMAQRLIDKGYAYVTNVGDVYFDVTSFPDYGKLSGRKLDELKSGEREISGSDKHNEADFALWRHADPEHLMKWDSPWGVGFPGWHIECSAMAMKYLGDTFDIHGGGLENQFPHNECEIAQAEALTGEPFAKYWLLTGSLTINGEKMSKSLGNFITVKDALKTYPAEAIRAFILSSHYSSPVDYSEEAVISAQKGLDRLMGAVRLTRHQLQSAPDNGAGEDFQAALDEARKQFLEAMDDDFNTPKAMGFLQNITRDVNTLLNGEEPVARASLEAIDTLYSDLGGEILGIVPDEVKSEGQASAKRQDELIQLLIDLRAAARQNKDFATSDRIRDELAAIGVALEDRPDGTFYKIQ